MDIRSNVILKDYTTMHLGGAARFMTDVHTPDEVAQICKRANEQRIDMFILGGGSNVIVNDAGFDGIVIHNIIPGFEMIAEDDKTCTFRIGAGKNWDDVVKKTVEMNLTGIEALSGIPGTAGAAPVQNIGAYGQEIRETLQTVEAYDIRNGQFVELTNDDCNFSYRNSIFRSSEFKRYVITSITLRLFKSPPQPPFYKTVQDYLDTRKITEVTPQVIRDAVLSIRKDKLPDPKIKPNAGSFFKNAIVEAWQLNDIKKEFPDVPNYEMLDETYKIPTGWLIEQAGLKGSLISGMRVHDKNALVLINEEGNSYYNLSLARDEIIQTVFDRFNITIEQEPIEM
jgi:UDP-N-acetylmuramate dehydrogenase